MTENNQREDLFRKIRGLLNKAEGTDNEHEASTFLGKAQELMLKYAVNEEEIWKNDLSKEPPAPQDVVVNIREKTGAKWLTILLNACAVSNRCMCYTHGGDVNNPHVVGFESDVLFVEILYVSIKNQMDLEMAINLAFTDENSRTFRNNFCEAFTYRIRERFRESAKYLRDSHIAHEGSTDLVIQGREQRVKEWVNENIGRLRSSVVSSTGRYSSGAQALGRLAADKADITGARKQTTAPKKELNK